MMSCVHLYMYAVLHVWQRRPTSHTAVSIKHASAAVSMLNQMTDRRSIMHEVKDVVVVWKASLEEC